MSSTKEKVNNLVNAVWQILDDMQETGLSCSLAAKAELRVAFEPFSNGKHSS